MYFNTIYNEKKILKINSIFLKRLTYNKSHWLSQWLLYCISCQLRPESVLTHIHQHSDTGLCKELQGILQ